MKHLQAEIIKQWLDDTAQDIWIWFNFKKSWELSCLEEMIANTNCEYAVGDRPTEPPEPPVKWCELAGVKFPAPVSDASLMEYGQHYWTAWVVGNELYINRLDWVSDIYDNNSIESGVAHLTKEAAVQHSKALQAANLQAIKEAK